DSRGDVRSPVDHAVTRQRTGELTQILNAVTAGDEQASARLLPLVYNELRALARARMAHERPGHTLQPTALVHEASLRLFGSMTPRWENRAHFFGAAAEAMRRILIERARRQARVKRGGRQQRVPLTEIAGEQPLDAEQLLSLDRALDRLEARDAAMAQVVKLRFFAGLTVDETAAALDVAPRTVDRHWTAARAWLHHELMLQPPA
ncbi:MAG TPA: sigma-70 family RNA polymerase sigma factor, partial [Vicinamibacterales bacterium]|nr:sigma-70 family RNA polymerase sigma factor [Vicinamibacterales bacterium]